MATFNGKVIGGGLNLRQSASTSSTSLVMIPENTNLTLIEEAGKNAWFKTTYGSYTGYVMAKFIAIENDGIACRVTTTSGRLNVRQTPSSSASIIFREEQNAIVRLLDSASYTGWYRISSSQGTGWAVSTYLTVITEPEDDEVTPGETPDAYAIVNAYGADCYKTPEFNILNNTWGTFAANTTIPVWFVNQGTNDCYRTLWSGNATGYVYFTDVTLIEDNTGTLQNGSTGASVIKYEQQLYYLGYHPGVFPTTYGSITEAAVKVFQSKNNLSVTGTINAATRTKLNDPEILTWAEKVGEWAPRTKPHYWYMDDSKWTNYPFPAASNLTGTIGGDGNSITTMASLLTAFSSSAVTPVEMADFAIGRGYRDQGGETGVSKTFFTNIGTFYSCLSYEGEVSTLAAVKNHLARTDIAPLAIIEVNANNETFTRGASQLLCYDISDRVYVLSPNSARDPDPFTEAQWAENGWFRTAYLYSRVYG